MIVIFDSHPGLVYRISQALDMARMKCGHLSFTNSSNSVWWRLSNQSRVFTLFRPWTWVGHVIVQQRIPRTGSGQAATQLAYFCGVSSSVSPYAGSSSDVIWRVIIVLGLFPFQGQNPHKSNVTGFSGANFELKVRQEIALIGRVLQVMPKATTEPKFAALSLLKVATDGSCL